MAKNEKTYLYNNILNVNIILWEIVS